MLSDSLLKALICPVCRGTPLSLVVEEADGDLIVQGDLTCPDCKRRYRVRDDIPVMMPSELGSNLSASNEQWRAWSSAMGRFLQWREAAWSDAEEALRRREDACEMHRRFIEFCDLQDVPIALLDVGCGTGHLADILRGGVDYVGLDPLPGGRSPTGEIPSEMPRPQRPVSLVQGVGELLPLADDSFDVILIAGALDHARSPEEMLDEAARVIRSGGALCVLLGLVRDSDDGGIGGALRSLARSLTGRQSPEARDTHMRTFASPDEVCELLAEHFVVRDTMEHANRLFVRATAPEDDG